MRNVKTMDLLLTIRSELVADFDAYIYSVRNGLDEDEEYTIPEDIAEDLRQIVFPAFLSKIARIKNK